MTQSLVTSFSKKLRVNALDKLIQAILQMVIEYLMSDIQLRTKGIKTSNTVLLWRNKNLSIKKGLKIYVCVHTYMHAYRQTDRQTHR